MPTNHVDRLIEAYLDNRLAPKARQYVETHLRDCPMCTRRFGDAKRLTRELGPLMQIALGQPTPQPRLRQQIKGALKTQQTSRLNFLWTVPAQLLNAAGTATLILLLVFGLFTVLQNQPPNANSVTNIAPLASSTYTNIVITPTRVAPILPPAIEMDTLPSPTNFSISDTLPDNILPNHTLSANIESGNTLPGDILSTSTPLAVVTNTNRPSVPHIEPETQKKIKIALSGQIEPDVQAALQQIAPPPLFGGTIAFALFNPAPDRQLYEIHFINPDGTNHHKFSLDGVSEPTLPPTKNDTVLAFRAWAGPTSPRSLLSGDLSSQHFKSVTNFWEDAQPDWSPVENRLIFASQRESDRRWRLYSVWGDGSLEVNLRREGKSPTFAPDGYRFAFESCNSIGGQCGLWLGDLEHSEYGSKPLLSNPSAKSPDWSPVAENIVYMDKHEGNWDLYLVDSSGNNNIRRLTDDPANDGLPVWSPDGEWLAFVSDRGGSWGLWVLHVRKGTLHQVVTFENGTLTPPNRLPYNQHGERYWWDEQLSWGL